MSFKELKPELMDLQTTWGSQIQAAKAPKGTEGAPFPVKVLLEMEQPPTCTHWDVEWLKVLLVIEGPEFDTETPEDLPFKVEFPQTDLPSDVRMEMAAMTLDHWRESVANGTDAPRWRLQDTLSWVQSNFDKLLRVIPKCVDWYMGEDKNGISQRRYTITPQVEVVIVPTPELRKKDADDDSDCNSDADEEGISPEEKERREAYNAKIAERERLKRIQEQREEEEYKREIARKKEEAMAARERGEVITKPNQLSKKELEEKRKSKQGVRTSKTGPKASKFSGEGSAIEKAKGGGKKKK